MKVSETFAYQRAVAALKRMQPLVLDTDIKLVVVLLLDLAPLELPPQVFPWTGTGLGRDREVTTCFKETLTAILNDEDDEDDETFYSD